MYKLLQWKGDSLSILMINLNNSKDITKNNKSISQLKYLNNHKNRLNNLI